MLYSVFLFHFPDKICTRCKQAWSNQTLTQCAECSQFTVDYVDLLYCGF